MDKLVGAGPMGADTQTMWIEEISGCASGIGYFAGC